MRARVGKSAEITWAQAQANERKIDRRVVYPGLAVVALLAVGNVMFGWSIWPWRIALCVVVIAWGRSMYWHGFHTGITHGREAEIRSRATRPAYLWTDDGATVEQRAQADG